MDAGIKHEPVADLWMSQLKAARELGISRYTVLGYVARGILTASVQDDRVLISRESVEALREQLQKAG